MEQPEFKSMSFEIKAASDGIIEGYAAAFGNVDLVDDIIEKGAFQKSIEDTGGIWPVLKQHNPDHKIGFNLEAREDDRGLFVKERLALNTTAGKDAFELSKLALEVGGKDGLSIGFFPIKAEPDRDNPNIRRLKEIKLIEHSHVTFAANQEAFSVAAKSWKNNKDLGLDKFTDLFFRHMEQVGHSYDDVKKALQDYEAARHAGRIGKSIERAISVLKSGA